MGDKMKKDKENKISLTAAEGSLRVSGDQPEKKDMEVIDMTPSNERMPVFGDDQPRYGPSEAEAISAAGLAEPDYFDVVIERMAKDFCITEALKEYDKLAPQSKDNAQPKFLWVRRRAKEIWEKIYSEGFGA